MLSISINYLIAGEIIAAQENLYITLENIYNGSLAFNWDDLVNAYSLLGHINYCLQDYLNAKIWYEIALGINIKNSFILICYLTAYFEIILKNLDSYL